MADKPVDRKKIGREWGKAMNRPFNPRDGWMRGRMSLYGGAMGKAVDDMDRERIDSTKNLLARLFNKGARRATNAGLGLADVNPRDYRLGKAMASGKVAEARLAEIRYGGFERKCAELGVNPQALFKVAVGIADALQGAAAGVAKKVKTMADPEGGRTGEVRRTAPMFNRQKRPASGTAQQEIRDFRYNMPKTQRRFEADLANQAQSDKYQNTPKKNIEQ